MATNRDILKRAIKALPQFRFEEANMWHAIRSHLDRSDGLNKSIDTLPGRKSPEGLWESVVEDLPSDETQLHKAINELPKYNYPSTGWHILNKKLDKSQLNNSRSIFSNFLKIAAAIVIVSSVVLGKMYFSKVKNRIEFTMDKVNPMDGMEIEEGINTIYNSALCLSNPDVCNTELFKSLDKQLEEVKTEIEIMKPMIKNEDPQITKYYQRLVNLRMELEMKMLRIIQNS